MIETVINLQGVEEPFSAKKLNNWVKDAVNGVQVDAWSQIALDAIKDMPKKVTVKQLIKSLIDTLLAKNTWTHYMLAGKLLSTLTRIEIFGSKNLPTVREVQDRLYKRDLMRKLNYSEYEWEVIERSINHDLDLTVPHFALEQIRLKYSLQDFKEKLEFETQQFVYMRMAMALFESHPETDPNQSLDNEDPSQRSRLEHVIRIYTHFAAKRLSAPTPNYNNLGTYHKGYASCCLIANDDNRFSLAAADHITYLMTTQSAGIGLNSMVRSLGDPVQKGRFIHRGKKPYIDVYGKNINANLQGGRGGAGTFYANLFDPEAKLIFGLRDTRAEDSARNRDAHYAFMSNAFFQSKVAKEEDVFSWNIYTAPDLHELFYSDDIKGFVACYRKYEADPNFKKVYTPARDLMLHALTQGVNTGTIYAASIDEMNRNTPFIDPIRSSNLCVSGASIIRTRDGDKPIAEYVNRGVDVWNGYEWSRVTPVQTSPQAKLYRVYTTIGKGFLDCTADHKWYVTDFSGKEIELRTHQLRGGEEIVPFYEPGAPAGVAVMGKILDVDDLGVENATFCFNEPLRHRAMFNGILTGNCLEVAEPTEPYTGPMATRDLYSEVEVGHAHFDGVTSTGRTIEYRLKASNVLRSPFVDGKKFTAQYAKVGKTFWDPNHGTVVIDKVHSIKKEPEVALCSLASVNLTEEMDEKTYADVMYYAYKMIDYCILENEYILPHMGVTAKARMNAGVGLMGLATHMARKKLKYSSVEGLQEIHRMFERHLHFAIHASIKISKERGLAPWIDRTKWPEGWTPLKSYKPAVDDIAPFTYVYDWDENSRLIKENGGLAHSCLINFMPGESSSKALGAVNSIYGIRKPVMIKTDGANVIRWAAPYGDNPEYEYESMWDLNLPQQNNLYALGQKFCDQSISADWYLNFMGRQTMPTTELLEGENDRVKKGVKTRYYINTLMPAEENTLKVSKSVHDLIAASANTGGSDGQAQDGSATLDEAALMAELAASGIVMEKTGGDGHLDCAGCSA